MFPNVRKTHSAFLNARKSEREDCYDCLWIVGYFYVRVFISEFFCLHYFMVAMRMIVRFHLSPRFDPVCIFQTSNCKCIICIEYCKQLINCDQRDRYITSSFVPYRSIRTIASNKINQLCIFRCTYNMNKFLLQLFKINHNRCEILKSK